MTRNELRDMAIRLVSSIQALTLEVEGVAMLARQFAEKVDAGVPVEAIGIPSAHTLANRATTVIYAVAKLDACAMMLADEGK